SSLIRRRTPGSSSTASTCGCTDMLLSLARGTPAPTFTGHPDYARCAVILGEIRGRFALQFRCTGRIPGLLTKHAQPEWSRHGGANEKRTRGADAPLVL